MKKIFLWGYWEKNFGDDLFLKVYLEKMKKINVTTYILTEKRYKQYYEKMGLKVVSKDLIIYKIIYRILTILNKPELYFLMVKKNDLFVMLGGSLFAENKGEDAEKKQLRNLDYAINKSEASFVIGSNFGPYTHNEFKEEYKRLFENVDSITFRDKNSYDLFNKTLNNVRYAPDIAFEGNWKENTNCTNDVIISVIDLEHRDNLAKYKEIYEKGIVEICLYHTKKKEKVFLLSLCEKEGDVVACQRIFNLLNEYDKKYVEVINYKSIDETVNLLSSAKKIYATRFHALMLALYFKKNVIPIIYNEKGVNAIKSYCNSMKWFLIENFCEENLELMKSINQTADLELSDSKQFQKLLEYCENRGTL